MPIGLLLATQEAPATMYTVKIKKQAERYLKKLPANVQERIRTEIAELANRPKHPDRKMKGFDSRYRIKEGAIRIIYEVEDDVLTVTVIKIGPRGDVYNAGGG